jgi:hypothetical protein
VTRHRRPDRHCKNERAASSFDVLLSVRRLRFIPPGALVEATARTVQSRLLLRPSPLACDLIVGVIGRAARLTGMRIVACVFLSNHFHLLLLPDSAVQLARFMCYVMSNVAREVGRLHGWRERFWGRRYSAIVISDEEACQIARLRYLLSHGVKEGLVAKASQWPGVHCAEALSRDEVLRGTWCDRTAEYRARGRARERASQEFESVEVVRFSPLPCWERCSRETRQLMIRDLLEEIERAAVNQLGARSPLGRRAVLRQHPHEAPATSDRRPAPAFHAFSEQARGRLELAYRTFLAAFRRAAELLRQGVFDAAFPADCFPPAFPRSASADPG